MKPRVSSCRSLGLNLRTDYVRNCYSLRRRKLLRRQVNDSGRRIANKQKVVHTTGRLQKKTPPNLRWGYKNQHKNQREIGGYPSTLHTAVGAVKGGMNKAAVPYKTARTGCHNRDCGYGDRSTLSRADTA